MNTTKTIRCGSCKGTHGSAAEVRACHENQHVANHPELFGRDDVRRATTRQYGAGQRNDAATDKQLAFIESLAADRDWESIKDGELYERIFDTVTKAGKLMTKREASRVIDFLKNEVPRKVAPPKPDTIGVEVPEGRYALPQVDGTGMTFWQVDRPTKGKWAGYVFVSQLVGSPGDFDQRRTSKDTRESVLRRIAEEGPAVAALRFSRKFTVCSRCMSPLSKVRSRATGFGPTCAGYLGVEYLDTATALRVLDEEGIDKTGLEDLEDATV